MELPQRKQLRLGCYDYSSAGYYFVTLCTQNKQKLFSIENGNAIAPKQNQIIRKWLIETEKKFGVKFDKFVIMPDHIHLIAVIPYDVNCLLQDVLQWFKTMTTNEYIRAVKTSNLKPFDQKLWQRSYHDHVIRGEQDYREIWQYIENNPLKYRLKTNGEI